MQNGVGMDPPARSEAEAWDVPASFPLRSRGAALQLGREGLCRVLRGGDRAVGFVPYREIVHFDATRLGLWLATRDSSRVLRRSRFRDVEAPEAAARVLGARIAQLPGGLEQLARIQAVDRLARAPARRLAARAVAVLCVLTFGLQLLDPFVDRVGAYVPGLVWQGELWRVVTANFLHGALLLPLHLGLNLLCILGFGSLVERPLGPARTLLIMAASAVGAMAGCHVAGYREVIGASGIALGLAGAVLYLELRWSERLPAQWRLPRRLFVTVLVRQGAVDASLPVVAQAAHLGGFAAGFVAAHLVATSALPGGVERGAAGFAIKLAVVSVVAAMVLAGASAAALLMRDAGALERHAERLLGVRESLPLRFNEAAWRMVTESQPGPKGLALAVELAERAVAETERLDPDILDTLSEALFAAGDRPAALAVIDEAIAITGGESYYVEQRRRFTGERAPDDRPSPPAIPWQYRPRPGLFEPVMEEPGIPI